MGKAMANRPQENPTMLCDFYELTMGNGYYRNGFYKRNVYFDVFFRNVPDGGGFAIAAGAGADCRVHPAAAFLR